jgi:hypothetical protein
MPNFYPPVPHILYRNSDAKRRQESLPVQWLDLPYIYSQVMWRIKKGLFKIKFMLYFSINAEVQTHKEIAAVFYCLSIQGNTRPSAFDRHL